MGGSSKPSTTTQQAQIPEFLKPYLQNQANVGNTALTNLQGQLQGAGADQLVAGFNPNQIEGQNRALAIANDPNGVLAQSQNSLADIASGNVVAKYAPELIGGYQSGMNADIGQFNLPGNAQTALDQSASGQFMYGNPAFDEAVQASIRAARPSILSQFAGQGGAGAAKGGLAQIGMQQAASDSFARLYGDERNRQLQSASQLGNFSLAGRDQQIQQQGMRNQATQAFGGLLSDERQRQLAAAGALPGVGLLGADVLQGIGAQQQELEQRRLTAPLTAQQMLLEAANAGPNLGGVIGQSTTQPVYSNKGAGALGGALTGAKLGSYFGPMGTGIGAVGGGILGLLG